MTKGSPHSGSVSPKNLRTAATGASATNAGGRSVTVQRMNLSWLSEEEPVLSSFSVEWWLPQLGAYSDSPAPAASALCWQWWQQTCDDIVTHLHESDTYAGPPHAVR